MLRPFPPMSASLTLPGIIDADATPARSLQIQIATRIATQRLHYRSGDEETAVASVHSLFGASRTLLITSPKARAFETAVEFFLNEIVRPCTARWHRWMVDGQFAEERARRQFRYELKQLLPQMQRFAELLGLMVAGPQEAERAKALFREIVEATPRAGRPANLGAPVKAGIGQEVRFAEGNLGVMGKFAGPDEINQAEWTFLRRRRQALQPPPAESSDCAGATLASVEKGSSPSPILDATGLCLSGGGIRSATFCLGIVQVLARRGMLPHFDYLSTVSGGGYLGCFLSSYLGTPEGGSNRPDKEEFSKTQIEAAIQKLFRAEKGPESDGVRHLRNQSRYLLNGGLWGRAKIFELLVTGVLTNVLLVLPFPLAAALATFGLMRVGFWGPFPADAPFRFGGSAAGLLGGGLALLLAMAWFGLPAVRSCARGKPPESLAPKFLTVWEAATIILGVVAAGAGGLLLVPQLFDGLEWLGVQSGRLGSMLEKMGNSKPLVLLATALGPVIFGLLTARLKSGRKKRWTAWLFALSGPFLYLVIFLCVGHGLLHDGWPWQAVAAVTAVLIIWGWLFVDVNQFSPHGYYRARLCECYLAVRQQDQTGRVRAFVHRVLHGTRKSEVMESTGIGSLLQLPLSQMNQTGAAPYHLVNTAANLPASKEPNLRGRDCDFFVFSRDFCGGPVCGYFSTSALEQLDPHVDLGTVMAISGAAASSNMGVKTLRQYRFLITLLNVRLGYWLRNPVRGRRRRFQAPGPLYLFREMIGWMHEKTAYLNLSDGGHIENLAIYELLRRRCKFIVLVDGGMEPGMECADLMLAQRYAQIDLGVRFELDVADLALGPQRRSRAYAVFGKIRYNTQPGTGAEDLGWLVYIKLACTGGEPGYVVDYRRQNPDFPHQSTADQLFDEAQFEAYRRLGECAAESLFRGELAGKPVNPQNEAQSGNSGFTTLREWFQALANNLLPDNDEAFNNPAQPAPRVH